MIQINELSKRYHKGDRMVDALSHVSINIPEKSFTLIKGPSGCGKSTLLFTIGGMLKPSFGEISVFGEELYNLKANQRRKIAAKNIGFVFQAYHLVPYLTVEENIKIQNKLPFVEIDESYVEKLISKLELEDRLSHKPSQLSAGEKQRVALVRALASHPKLILADEPTGNLDPKNARIVLSFLDEFRDEGGTIIMVTHSTDADRFASQIIQMRKGKISSN